MAKTLNGGAVINYGGVLPVGNLSYDGYLFYKNTGADAGLYLYSYKQDTDSTLGQAQVHGWNPIATTELFVSKLGDTMSGPLTVLRTYTATAYNTSDYALNLANTGNTAGARSGAIQWRIAGATSAVSAQIDIVNGTSNSSAELAIGTRGPTGGITERVRVNETGLITTDGKKYWNENNDGSGSGLDADLLDGKDSTFFQNASNINAGTIAEARLPFTPVQQGGGANQGGNKVHIGWASAGAVANTLQLQVDSQNFANVWPISINGNAATANTANSATSATNATNAVNSQFQWLNGVTTGGRIQFNSTASATSPTYVVGTSTIAAGTGTTITQFHNVASLSVASAATATKLASAQTINGVPFDGTQPITVADNTKLPLAGGTLTGNLRVNVGTDTAGIGTGALVVSGGVGIIKSVNVGGNITAVGTVASTSDIRVKSDLKRIEDALDKVDALGGWTYDRIDMVTPRQAGVIAQDAQKVLPESVVEDTEGNLAVNYNGLTALLIEAVKELRAEVNELKKKIG